MKLGWKFISLAPCRGCLIFFFCKCAIKEVMEKISMHNYVFFNFELFKCLIKLLMVLKINQLLLTDVYFGFLFLIFFFMDSPGHHIDFMYIFSRGVGRRRVM